MPEIAFSIANSEVYTNESIEWMKFQTFELYYPAHQGAGGHNVTDIMKQYKFENVKKLKLIVIAVSEKSVFDFGIYLSLFST